MLDTRTALFFLYRLTTLHQRSAVHHYMLSGRLQGLFLPAKRLMNHYPAPLPTRASHCGRWFLTVQTTPQSLSTELQQSGSSLRRKIPIKGLSNVRTAFCPVKGLLVLSPTELMQVVGFEPTEVSRSYRGLLSIYYVSRYQNYSGVEPLSLNANELHLPYLVLGVDSNHYTGELRHVGRHPT